MVDALDQTGSKPFAVVPDKPAEDAAEVAGIRPPPSPSHC